MDRGWIFPYEEIARGSGIVLYGAGNVGKCIYKQVKFTNYCNIVAWLDAQFDKYQSKGLNVSNPMLVTEMEFDYVLIAIDSPETSREVLNFLTEQGVDEEKIWSPFKKRTDSIIESEEETVVDEVNISSLQNKPDLSHLRVAFIIPSPIKGGGGHRNIFRAIRHLIKSGHSVDVYYINDEKSSEDIKKNVCEWFYDLSTVTFIKYAGQMGFYDAGVATWWETAYIIKKFDNHFRKHFYFTQDFEPFFYPMSSNYILAENTYRVGFKHICSGTWCEKMLKERYNAEAMSFQFPIDRKVYNSGYTRKKVNKNVVFFAKPEMPRRCFEIGVKALEIFHKKRPDVEIILFGSKVLNRSQISFNATIKNIVPTIEELARLYADADVGIVFSTTNPSLVPYEMMSCGCPVVDLDLEYALSKYGDDNNNVFLFDPIPNIFAQQLEDIIDDNELLYTKAKHALEWVNKEFPNEHEMGNIVENEIINGIKDAT